MSQEYRRLRALLAQGNPPGGLGIGTLEPPGTAEALEQLQLSHAHAAAPADRQLLAAAQTMAAALLCLRCRVSHPVETALRGYQRQYGQAFGLELVEMATYALDDDGRPLPALGDDQRGKADGRRRYEPFSVAVVGSFDPERSGLPHWARQRLRSHPPLKTYFLEHHLLLISDWALLARSSGRRVRDCWPCLQGSALSLEQAVALHRDFLPAYHEAMAAHRALTGRGSGWLPDGAFLRALRPELPVARTHADLCALATALRRVATGRWQQSIDREADGTDPIEGVADPAGSEAQWDEAAAADAAPKSRIEAALKQAMDAVLPAAIKGSRPGEEEMLLKLWAGFVEGLSGRELARRYGISQATVSRRLDVERRARIVARKAAVRLKPEPALRELFASVEAAERLEAALVNHLLDAEPEGGDSPLRRWLRDHLPSPDR